MENMIGLVAVILSLGFPMGAIYTYYGVRKLRSQERLAAMARGVEIPMEPELPQGARSRRWGILLVSGALGYMAATGIIAHFAEPDAWTAATLGVIPFALGLGFFVDWTLLRRDARVAS
jgi:hypothetical protein